MDKVPERSDLADTFNWFRTYLISKPESFNDEISVSGKDIDNITRSIKREVSVKFKHEGNKIQYINFNSDLLSVLAKVQKHFINKLNKRNKLIRIADISPPQVGQRSESTRAMTLRQILKMENACARRRPA